MSDHTARSGRPGDGGSGSRPAPAAPPVSPCRVRKLLSLRGLLSAALVFVPADLAAAAAGVGHMTVFVLSVLALIPLAWLIGEGTEQIGAYTGPAVAGLLNASFGNAPELIVALFAVGDGLFGVARGTLTGSVISNLLLLLGSALLAGGRGRLPRGDIYRSLSMVALALLLFIPPSVAEAAGTPRLGRNAAIAAVLLAVYAVVTARSIRREHREHQERGEPGDPDWTLPRALVTLTVAMAATVAVSDVLTGSIRAFADVTGLSATFVAVAFVAIAGNAAEYGGTLVIASRGGVRLASAIALHSAPQVAMGVIPAAMLVSLAVHPITLAFSGVEFFGIGVAVTVPAVLLSAGRASRWRGAGLCAAYAAVIAAFYVAT